MSEAVLFSMSRPRETSPAARQEVAGNAEPQPGGPPGARCALFYLAAQFPVAAAFR